MPKNNGHGQAAKITKEQELLIRENLFKPMYQVIFDVIRFTGERAGAVRQLQISDVYDYLGNPLTHVTFRKETRKKSGGKMAETRQVAMHPKLKSSLELWRSPSELWLFPGRGGQNPISHSSFDKALRRACEKVGLKDAGISTHSGRVTAISRMSDAGFSNEHIKNVIGHKDIKTTSRYIQRNPDIERKAIEVL